MIWRPWKRERREEDREDVISEDGTITFNYLQQRPVDTTERPQTPLEEIGTTDPWGITTG
jgi:hypothetical protein